MASEYDDVLRALARQQTAGFNTSPFSQAVNLDLSEAVDSVARALALPGDTLRGEYNQVEVGPDGSVTPFDPRMMGEAANMAGLVSLGAAPMPRPVNSIGMGGRLPSSDSLNIPRVPTPDDMARAARVEKVPLSAVRATQDKMDWDKFNSGDHPPPLVEGYVDRPVAVRKENGEYLVFDGHHRAASALESGVPDMEMYVIDAKSYHPEAAGRKPAKDDMSLDDLYTALFGDD